MGTIVAAVVALDLSTLRDLGAGPALGHRRLAPWYALVAAGVLLESVGLWLGGRSTTVPTLSTVVDHSLSTHAFRFVLFEAWIAIAVVPAARRLAARAP